MEAATAPRDHLLDERPETVRSGSILVLCTAELSPCTCPDACDRDHDRD